MMIVWGQHNSKSHRLVLFRRGVRMERYFGDPTVLEGQAHDHMAKSPERRTLPYV